MCVCVFVRFHSAFDLLALTLSFHTLTNTLPRYGREVTSSRTVVLSIVGGCWVLPAILLIIIFFTQRDAPHEYQVWVAMCIVAQLFGVVVSLLAFCFRSALALARNATANASACGLECHCLPKNIDSVAGAIWH